MRNFIVFILILPAFIIGPLRLFLKQQLPDIFFVNSYLYFLIIFFIIGLILNRKQPRSVFVSLFTLFFFILLHSNDFESLLLIFSILIPLLTAKLFVNICSVEILDSVIKFFIRIFAIYMLINVSMFYSGLLPSNIQNRMGGSFGEILTQSYLTTILFVLSSYYNKGYKYKKLLDFILIVGVFLSGTRLSIIIVLLFMQYSWIKKSLKNKFLPIFLLFNLLIITFVLNIENFNYGRFASLSVQNERVETWLTGLTFYYDSNFISKIIGSGFNSFYKYFDWFINGQLFWDNKFKYKNLTSLIQPHNTFLWILIEGGIVMFVYIFSNIPNLFKYRLELNSQKKSVLFFSVLIVIITCNFDSVLVLYPNISFSMWFIIFTCNKVFLNEKNKYSIK